MGLAEGFSREVSDFDRKNQARRPFGILSGKGTTYKRVS